jgi:hypothetical protein
MSERPYFNEATQAQRREALLNDQAQHSTMFERARNEIGLELGGRFAKYGQEQQVVGTGPSPYPRMSGGPWSKPDPSGTEPSLGYSVDQLEPIGGPPETVDGAPRLEGPPRAENSALPSEPQSVSGPSLLRGKI